MYFARHAQKYIEKYTMKYTNTKSLNDAKKKVNSSQISSRKDKKGDRNRARTVK